MNICYVLMGFPVPSETFVSSDIKAIERAGGTVSVRCFRPKNSLTDSLIQERELSHLDIKHNSVKLSLLGVARALFSLNVLWALFTWLIKQKGYTKNQYLKTCLLFPIALYHFFSLKESKVDIVHLFWGHYPVMLGYLLKRFTNIKVTTFLGAHDLEVNYPPSFNFSQFYADSTFTHSLSNLPKLQSAGLSKSDITVVPRGTVICSSVNEKEKMSFLTASRLIESKNVSSVIRAFAIIKDNFPSANLTIAGDGPERKNLLCLTRELGVSSSVQILGHVSQDYLFKLMERNKYFLFFSEYKGERLPNVVKEAMVRRCIVMSSLTEGIGELIENGVDGFVFRDDYEEQALDIVRTVEKGGDRIGDSIKECARKKIEKKFSVDRQMSMYMSSWAEILEV